jgi:hypothetical protein
VGATDARGQQTGNRPDPLRLDSGICLVCAACLTPFTAPPIVPSRGAHTFREGAAPLAAAPRCFTSTSLGSRWLHRRVQFMAKGNFGERLKRERELREVTPNEVVVATRISLRFLEALENEDWDKLPGGIFNRGFVRAIARYLGLDEENLLAEYDLARGESAESVSAPESRIPQPSKWLAVGLVLAGLAIIAALLAVGIYGWRRYSSHRPSQPSSSITTHEVTAGLRPGVAGSEPPHDAAHRFPGRLRYNSA